MPYTIEIRSDQATRYRGSLRRVRATYQRSQRTRVLKRSRAPKASSTYADALPRNTEPHNKSTTSLDQLSKLRNFFSIGFSRLRAYKATCIQGVPNDRFRKVVDCQAFAALQKTSLG